MEEKIYERQVAKQSISHRVVDELQTARLFTQTELLELYKLEPYKKNKINTTDLKVCVAHDNYNFWYDQPCDFT